MSQPSLSRLRPIHAALASGTVLLVVYLLTMNRTLGFIDKGELATVASTLGVAHPTGYPTFTLVGHLFTLLPLRPILSLNILSALATAVGCAISTLIFLRVLDGLDRGLSRQGKVEGANKQTGSKGKEKKGKGDAARVEPVKEQQAPAYLNLLLASLGGLLLGLGAIWWGQGNGIEVYSLHAVLLPLVLLLYLRFVERERTLADAERGWRPTREGIAFAVVLGLAFTNHMSTIFLAPALLVDYFTRNRQGLSDKLVRLAGLVPWVVLGLLPYLYLPLRAMSSPELNWGNPSSFENFLAHLSGKQYSVWMFNGSVLGDQLGWLVRQLPSELGYLGLILVPVGIAALLSRSRRLGFLLLGVLVVCVLWAGMYAIYDIGSYFMAALLALVALVVAGAWELARRAGHSIALGALAATAIAAGALNWSASNESSNVVVEEMTRNVLNGLPQRAMILSAQWDFWVSASYYMQRVEGVRPDVVVIDPELLRRSWYLDQLAVQHPALMARTIAPVEAFKKAVYPFDHGLDFDGRTIDAAYYGMIDSIVAAGVADGRQVYVTSDVDRRAGSSWRRVPEGLALRLTRDSVYQPTAFPNWSYTPWFGRIDNYTLKIPELYATAAAMRMEYENFYGHRDAATRYRELALRFEPGFDARSIPRLPLRADTNARRSLELFGQIARMGQTAGAR